MDLHLHFHGPFAVKGAAGGTRVKTGVLNGTAPHGVLGQPTAASPLSAVTTPAQQGVHLASGGSSAPASSGPSASPTSSPSAPVSKVVLSALPRMSMNDATTVANALQGLGIQMPAAPQFAMYSPAATANNASFGPQQYQPPPSTLGVAGIKGVS